MNLRLYVWKEWRDQRAGLARLALVLVLLAACALFLPKPVANDPIFVAGFVGAALVAYLLSVGADLLAGELARDRVRFLERQPGGLSAAFAGKLVLFAGAGLAVALLGLVLAVGVASARTDELPLWALRHVEREHFVAGVTVLAWTFAASAWLPRSALALPVALALVALLTWPVWLAAGPAPWYAPADGELELYAVLCLAGAPLSAWASFALGYRRGGGSPRAFGVGVGVAMLVLLPAWSWTAMHARSLLTLDPSSRDLRIADAVVGAEERFLFLTCTREPSLVFAVVVDLSDGSWRATSRARIAHGAERLGFGVSAVALLTSGGTGAACLDARTGDALAGRPAWPEHGWLPEAAELGLADDWTVSGRRGLGYAFISTMLEGRSLVASYAVYDPLRGAVYPLEELRGPQGDLTLHLVRGGDWVARPPMSADVAWVRLDPETGETGPVAGLRAGEEVLDVLPDGRLVVWRGERGAALLDPETGERVPLALAGDTASHRELIALRSSELDPLVFFVSASAGTGWQGIARLDPERAVLRPALGASGLVRYLGGPDADTAYVIEDDARVVKVRFGSDERAVLFPPPEDGR